MAIRSGLIAAFRSGTLFLILTFAAVAGELQVADLGVCQLESGEKLEPCNIAYRRYGKLAPDKSNVVLMLTWYNGNVQGLVDGGYLGPGKIVDTDRYHVIAVNALGNGVSSSPSNHPTGLPFPAFSIRDLVGTQHRLLTEELGFDRVHGVVGVSMGGQQVYEWIMLHPRFANRYVPIEGSPWPTHYDRLLRSTWHEVLAGDANNPDEARRMGALLTTIGGLMYWTPDYINRESGSIPFPEYLEKLRARDDADYLVDRASQTKALLSQDIRAPYPDFEKHLETLGNPSVLAVVFESDMAVNPAPNHELAAMMDFEVAEFPGDCGHWGPEPECYQAEVAERVQEFLSGREPESRPMHRRTLIHDGIEREFFVHMPANIPADSTPPVVFALHGYGTTATGFAAMYDLNRHADRHGYAVIYPQGSYFKGSFGDDPGAEKYFLSSWNDQVSNFTPGPAGLPHCTEDRLKYPCPPECDSCNHCGWVSCHDDFGFLTRVLDAVQSEFRTDSDRYYLLGNSNGGTMAFRLACDMPVRFAAVAVLTIQMPPGFGCGPGRSLPLLHLYGEQDETVGFDGTPTPDGWIYTSAADTARVWAEALHCQNGSAPWRTATSESLGLSCLSYGDCRVSDHQVISCRDPEAGHEWRGQRLADTVADCVSPEQQASLPSQPACAGATPRTGAQGMDLVWEFFRQHSRSGQHQIARR